MATPSMPKMKLEHGTKVSVVDWPKDFEALCAVAKKNLGIQDDSIIVKTGRKEGKRNLLNTDLLLDSEDAFQAYSVSVANTQVARGTFMVITIETPENSVPSKPFALHSGLGWQDLLNDAEDLPPVEWPSITALVQVLKYGKGVTLCEDLRFQIEVTGKNRIHLLVCDDDDEDGLSASEVLQLQKPTVLVG